jgi:hypothetical protein
MQDPGACKKKNFHPFSPLAQPQPLHISSPTGEGLIGGSFKQEDSDWRVRCSKSLVAELR